MKRLTTMLAALLFVTGVFAQTITVAQALQNAASLSQGQTSTETYTIEGYVTVITENAYNENFNNMTFWIADSRGTAASNAKGALYVYRGRPSQELKVGDKIRVVSTLKNFNGLIETAIKNAPVTWLESAPSDPGQSQEQESVTGSLRVCAQNLENYYYNITQVNPYTNGKKPRNYYTTEEFVAKTRKIVDNMIAIDADIYAFCEVEAQPIVLAQLADSMNAHVNSSLYAAVSDGISEAWNATTNNNIKSGFIYRKDKIKTYGNSNPGSTANYYKHTMRIQNFEVIASKEQFALSMNHFKAKDESEDEGNSLRKTNANSLITALKNYAYDPDILILGDLNCEVGEDPLNIIENAGYTEQILRFNPNAYSHCHLGTPELIDHVYANASMSAQIVNAYVKHVSTYKCTYSVSQADSYSDHDPYVIEINLNSSQDIPQLSSPVRAKKTIESGQLILTLPDGSRYNVMGIKVR